MNIVLAGMPGSGKTSVSLALGRLTGRKVYDTDAEIVARHGEINKIFADFGEEYFRRAESAVCESLSVCDGAVISTGGGCLMRESNVETLKKSGKIVYLRTELKTLEKRLEGDNTRPLLAEDLKGRLSALMSVRAHVYESCADLILDTDGLSPEEIALKIKENLL